MYVCEVARNWSWFYYDGFGGVIDRVGIELPSVEVRYENFTVKANCHIGNRGLPTLLNVLRNIGEVNYSPSHINFFLINFLISYIDPHRQPLELDKFSSHIICQSFSTHFTRTCCILLVILSSKTNLTFTCILIELTSVNALMGVFVFIVSWSPMISHRLFSIQNQLVSFYLWCMLVGSVVKDFEWGQPNYFGSLQVKLILSKLAHLLACQKQFEPSMIQYRMYFLSNLHPTTNLTCNRNLPNMEGVLR